MSTTAAASTIEAVAGVNRAVEDVAWRLIVTLSATAPGDLPPSYHATARRLLDDAITLLHHAAPYLEDTAPRDEAP